MQRHHPCFYIGRLKLKPMLRTLAKRRDASRHNIQLAVKLRASIGDEILLDVSHDQPFGTEDSRSARHKNALHTKCSGNVCSMKSACTAERHQCKAARVIALFD